jgi:hypothetical protein
MSVRTQIGLCLPASLRTYLYYLPLPIDRLGLSFVVPRRFASLSPSPVLVIEAALYFFVPVGYRTALHYLQVCTL